MDKKEGEYVQVRDLRIGMYVELDLGWMAHPFPTGSFKIASAKQIETIRGLGLEQVRFIPAKSDVVVEDPVDERPTPPASSALSEKMLAAQRDKLARQQRAELLGEQQRSLVICERRFNEAARQYRRTLEQVHTQPQAVARECQALVQGFVGEVLGEGESAIRLLSETAGDKSAMHPVNVTVVSLLLGRAMGLPEPELVELGLAAYLHDVGKTLMPDRVRWLEDNFSSAEYKLYQEHVAQSLVVGKSMGLTLPIMQAIAQHHELADGSGFPGRIKGTAMTRNAHILALVNRYDNLCNPARVASAMTPHEALSLIFAQLKTRFDGVALSAFIRMMGVYPPGSVVQLSDERYAMVVSVNSARPLKPRVIVHDAGVPKHEALILDLERNPQLSIRRSLKPASLPAASQDYLSPRQRVSYFFEKVSEAPATETND